MNQTDDRKVCFILCSSDRLYTEECIYFINHLAVPEGYRIEVLTVEGAAFMTAGYNEGMQASDAKYKVYLHQDVFIVNHFFIREFLDIFESDERIGMIGMVGAEKLPASGIMWEVKRCGAIYGPIDGQDQLLHFGGDSLMEVEAIDGLLMITQYDIPWREDLFDKWDFYDCSQSQEFIRKGFKVVVPNLATPWCLHDNRPSDLSAYHGERKKFLQEYFEKPGGQERGECSITVILTTSNRLKALQDTLQWLEGVEEISNLIIVDNGSRDGTAQWLTAQAYDYVLFDEGITGYGKLWNTVLTNFEMGDCIVFLEAGVCPRQAALAELAQALRTGEFGMVSPVSNSCFTEGLSGDLAYYRSLCADWQIWAAHRRIFEEIGLFHENLSHPEEVLKDYSLRMIKNGRMGQAVCPRAYAYKIFSQCGEVYDEEEQWLSQDRKLMKNEWGMNYFNLRPNLLLADCIQEERETQFSVLEVGCDLGATLYEIQSRFPNCKTFGMDINEAAVNIAKQIVHAAYGNIEELRIPFEEKFDYIIFGDVLEHLRNPKEVIIFCRELLKESGYLIACIPNVMHISVMEQLVDGRFHYEDQGLLDRTHIHMFTYYEIKDMFENAGYTGNDIQSRIFPVSGRQEQMISALLALSNQTEEWMYRTFQYVVKARK